jgi:hypothetical protein
MNVVEKIYIERCVHTEPTNNRFNTFNIKPHGHLGQCRGWSPFVWAEYKQRIKGPDIEGPTLPPAHPIGHEEMQAPPLRALHDKVTESTDVLRPHDVPVTINASFP